MTTRLFLATLFSIITLKAQAIIRACAPSFSRPDQPCNGQCPSCRTLMSNRNYPSTTNFKLVDVWWRPSLEYDPKLIVSNEVCEYCRCVFSVTMEKV